MNPFEMVVLIVAISAVASIFRAKYGYGRRGRHGRHDPEMVVDDAETRQLREDVKILKDRVAVLERIATDKSNLLEQEFERLRDER